MVKATAARPLHCADAKGTAPNAAAMMVSAINQPSRHAHHSNRRWRTCERTPFPVPQLEPKGPAVCSSRRSWLTQLGRNLTALKALYCKIKLEAVMPIILWLLGVPLVVVVLLMLTHII
jgi:hypothetical protein